jgi:hypothetical protein
MIAAAEKKKRISFSKEGFHFVSINVCLLLSTIPFFSPLLIPSDLQILIFCFSLTILFVDIITLRVSLRYFECYFLFFSLMSIVYINPWKSFEYDFATRFSFILSFSLYYAVSRYWKYAKSYILIIGLLINLIATLAHSLSPDVWINFMSGNFVNDFRGVARSGGRGVSGLTPEAGILGGMAVYMMMMGYIFYHENKMKMLTLSSIFFSTLIIIILSSSGTGMLFFALFFMLCFLVSKVDLMIKIIVFSSMFFGATLIFTVVLNSEVEIRGVELILTLLSSPSSFLNDSSIIYRMLPFLTGMFSLIDGYLLGQGAGSLSYVALEVLPKYLSGNDILRHLDVVAGLGSSAFGLYVTEMGLLFLILLILLYFNHNGKGYVLPVRSISFLFVLASFAIVFPPIWFILGATHKPRN